MSLSLHSRVRTGRALIGLVFLWNIQCAIVFLLFPSQFAPGFELQGDVGDGVIRALGLLFLMWNVPYAFALSNPLRFRVSLLQAVLMQAVGFVGESLLLVTFPSGHPVLSVSLERFILFDGAGFALLAAAWWITRSPKPISGSAAEFPSEKS